MEIFDNLETKKISKGTIILRKGDICRFSYRVLNGCLKSYVLDSNGKEHILQFAIEDWIVSDMDSVVNEKESKIFIEAVEDSEVKQISVDLIKNLEELDKQTLITFNNRLIRNVIATNKRLTNLLSATSEERYLDFIETYPTLLQRIPLKLIASYLGMTPEYLSEIRRKLTLR